MVKPLAADEAVRWVSEYLDTYCVPGTHHFATASRTTRWCTVCYKEESRSDESCMICNLRGQPPGISREKAPSRPTGSSAPTASSAS
jgi:hypothetical protein